MEKVYKVKEAAERLKVSPKTIKRLLISGRLSGFRVGGTPRSHWRINEKEIERFIEEKNKSE